MGTEGSCHQGTWIAVKSMHTLSGRPLECHGPGRRCFFSLLLWPWPCRVQHCNPGFHHKARKGHLCYWQDTLLTAHFNFIVLTCSSFTCLWRDRAGHPARTPRNIPPDQQRHIHCIQLEPPTARTVVWERIFFQHIRISLRKLQD